MSRRDIGKEILEGLQEIKAFKTGQKSSKTIHISEPFPQRKRKTQSSS